MSNRRVYLYFLTENRVTFYLKVTTEKEGQDPKCYKTTAGILVPQTLA